MMASQSKVIYIGQTNSLSRRTLEHKAHRNKGFSHRYHVTKLVYFEVYETRMAAFTRERQLKGWRRSRKVALIEEENPNWYDLGYVEQTDFVEYKESMGL